MALLGVKSRANGVRVEVAACDTLWRCIMSANKGRTALPVILERLHQQYPDARYELEWETPLELLVATIHAAQCTDERVNQVTRTLFRKYPDARAYAEAELDELAGDIRQTGFFNEKARAIQLA